MRKQIHFFIKLNLGALTNLTEIQEEEGRHSKQGQQTGKYPNQKDNPTRQTNPKRKAKGVNTKSAKVIHNNQQKKNAQKCT